MMSKITPLNAVHRQLGAIFCDFAGWSMPVRYASETLEHVAVRTAAGMFDLCHMGEIEVAGPQAAAVLDYSLVGSISIMPVGRAKYTMLCDESGGIVDDLVVYRIDKDRFFVVANASNSFSVLIALLEHAVDFDADVRDVSADWALIAVQGPMSTRILSGLTDVDPSLLKYYSIDEAKLAGHEVLLARTGYTGEDGFEIYSKARDAPLVWSALMTVGTPYGLVPAGLASRDTLRLEAGMPLYGHELTRTTTPFEAGLGRVVAFDKDGAFVGQRALMAHRDARPTRILVGLVSSGRRSPRADYRVVDRASGLDVGLVTSGAPSPTLGCPIAIAYVSVESSEPGTELAVDIRGTLEDVTVVALPFYRRTPSTDSHRRP